MPVLPGTTVPIIYVKDVLRGAMRLLGYAGQTPTADELNDCLYAFNSMLGTWANEPLNLYTIRSDDFTLVPSQQRYTLGSGGDWDIDRPLWIKRAKLTISSLEYEVKVCTDKEWADIAQKTLESDIPRALHNHGEYPLSDVDIWPVPTQAYVITLYTPQLVNSFAIGDELLLPQGYEEALRYNLALRMATEFGKAGSPEYATIVAIAASSKAAIMRTNSEDSSMDCDSALTSDLGTGLVDKAAFNSGGFA